MLMSRSQERVLWVVGVIILLIAVNFAYNLGKQPKTRTELLPYHTSEGIGE